MYDDLEGLDYVEGELSRYVDIILKNIKESQKNGDIVQVSRDKVKTGDVHIRPFSSHLVKDGSTFASIVRISGKEDAVTIIPAEVIERVREGYDRSKKQRIE